MYHLLSVSSAMLISFLIGLLFAAMCAIVGRQKGYSTALCILLGFFGRLICLLILILLPDRMQEQYESDHLKQELRTAPSEAGAVLSTPTDGRTGAGFGTNARPGACRPGSGCSSSAPQASAGRPCRLSRPDGGGHRLPPVWPPPEGQSGFLLRLWPAVSI